MLRLLAAAAVTAAVLAPGAAQAATPCAEAYVALGDSYAAGVGAPPYLDPSCLRTNGGYPGLLAAAKGYAPFTFDACSGATTADLLANQLGGLDRRTRVVTVTIGGNDLGFSTGVGACMQGSDATCAAVVATAETFVAETLPARLDTVFRTIRRKAPNARVVATGYPHLFETTSADCATVPPASLVKRTALNEAVDTLDAKIAERAARNGVTYADVRSGFAGHALCADTPWLGGLTSQAPFHPTAAGYQEAYLPVVEKAVAKRH